MMTAATSVCRGMTPGSPTRWGIPDLKQALEEKRYEAARRIGFALLGQSGEMESVICLLHDALSALGELPDAINLITASPTGSILSKKTKAALLARDYERLSSGVLYRTSPEAREGFTFEEYRAKYRALARKYAAARIEASACRGPCRARPLAAGDLRSHRSALSTH